MEVEKSLGCLVMGYEQLNNSYDSAYAKYLWESVHILYLNA